MSEFGSTETGDAREQLCADALRVLAMDGVQQANSGHPGMPMGMADAAHVLWSEFLRLDPQDPTWIGRDRFVLSAGHGSMLLYGLMHLAGYAMPMEQLQQFRQLGSKTPGHPENFVTPGVETTTGPLGQGLGNAVGMALAERHLVATNPQAADVLAHRTYVIAGDGDLMEGVASEAASLAGHLGLGRLVVLYDDNEITIDGRTSIAFTEDVLARFEAYGWRTDRVDGHDRAAVKRALEAACAQEEQPTLISCRTVIGKGSPNKADSSSAHGSPLGSKEIELTKAGLGWPQDAFLVPPAVRARWSERQAEWRAARGTWDQAWAKVPAADQARLTRWFAGEIAELSEVAWPQFEVGKGVATRSASGKVLNALGKAIPNLLGGSADLAGSNKTDLNGESDCEKGAYGGRNLRFGVREHGMGAIVNGMALHGGVIPYAASFLVFSDYCRPAIRLSALMETRVVWVMTHDSIFLGEDGPTHQPIEHLMALRTIPGLRVFRPADANETAESWRLALEYQGPSVLALTRQDLPTLDRTEHAPVSGVRKGGYVLWESDPGQDPSAILIATGSEVEVALEVGKRLKGEGVSTRVVSLPCWRLFSEQSADYREEVLPGRCGARVSIEAGCTFGWERYTGDLGLRIGIDTFGASAPAEVLAEHFGLSADKVTERVRGYLHDMAVAQR
ncbi:MAG: transketolase [Planctomycetota bacterium]